MAVVNDRPGAFELGDVILISYRSFDGSGSPKRLDIRNPTRYITLPFQKIKVGGTTHFNYNNTGEFYIRGIKKQANGLK